MRLHKVEFQFKIKSIKTKKFENAPTKVVWTPTGKSIDTPIYDGTLPKFIGKKYNWLVIATYCEIEYKYYTFYLPSQTNARYYIKKAQADYEKDQHVLITNEQI
jgi:hypothetical protein